MLINTAIGLFLFLAGLTSVASMFDMRSKLEKARGEKIWPLWLRLTVGFSALFAIIFVVGIWTYFIPSDEEMRQMFPLLFN